MKHQAHLTLATLLVQLFVVGGCSQQATPADASEAKMEEAPVDQPSPEVDAPPPAAPFPPAITWGDPDPACAADERSVTVHRERDSFNDCAKTVPQAELGQHAGAGTILIEAPVLTRYARYSNAKGAGWTSPGVALLQPDGSLVPLTQNERFLGCEGHPQRGAPDEYRCPAAGAARILGIATRHEFPGRAPDFTFELFGAEPATPPANSAGATTAVAPLPLVRRSSDARPLPLAESCDDWKKCSAGELCLSWDEQSGGLCVPEVASLDALTTAHYSRPVVLREATATIEAKPCAVDCDDSKANTLVFTRKKGAALTVTRPLGAGLNRPVECGSNSKEVKFAGCPLAEENELVVGVVRPIWTRVGGAPELEFEILARGVQFARESARIREQRIETCSKTCEGKSVCVRDPDTQDDICIAPSSTTEVVHYDGDDLLLVDAPVVKPAPQPSICTQARCWPEATLMGPKGERVPMEVKVTGRKARAPLRCTPKPNSPNEWDCPGAGSARIYGHVRPRSAPDGAPRVTFELLGVEPGTASEQPAGSTPGATPPAAAAPPATPSNSGETATAAPKGGAK